MKISVKQYAKALFESVEGKTDSQVKDVIENFVKLLAKKNDLKKAEKIINSLISMRDESEGLVRAEITSLEDLNSSTVSAVKDFIAKSAKAKTVVLEQKINKKILGGIVIKFRDKILDGSLKTRLGELKEKLVK